jgi:hypothetical protein
MLALILLLRLIGYFLFFCLKFSSYSLVLHILLLFFCFGLVVVPFVATYGSLFFLFRRMYGSFCDDLLTYGHKNIVFSVLIYFSCCKNCNLIKKKIYKKNLLLCSHLTNHHLLGKQSYQATDS